MYNRWREPVCLVLHISGKHTTRAFLCIKLAWFPAHLNHPMLLQSLPLHVLLSILQLHI